MATSNESGSYAPQVPGRVCITGASGLIGTALLASLTGDGVSVSRFVRQRVLAGYGAAYWNPDTGEIDASVLEGADAVVHLAGESVADGRWTRARKQRIVDSRVKSTALLARAVASCANKPKVFVTASGVGFYGHQPSTAVDESSPVGTGFLAQVCAQWEAAAVPAAEAGIRVVHARFGLVLAQHGGALPKMLAPIRAGIGGHLGSGDQYVPWVMLDDAVAVLRRVMDDTRLRGPVNVVAPEPCTNREMTQSIARAIGRRTFVPVPRFALKLGLGEMAEELLLSGARVRPRALERVGFRFDHPRFEDAITDLLEPASR